MANTIRHNVPAQSGVFCVIDQLWFRNVCSETQRRGSADDSLFLLHSQRHDLFISLRGKRHPRRDGKGVHWLWASLLLTKMSTPWTAARKQHRYVNQLSHVAYSQEKQRSCWDGVNTTCAVYQISSWAEKSHHYRLKTRQIPPSPSSHKPVWNWNYARGTTRSSRGESSERFMWCTI